MDTSKLSKLATEYRPTMDTEVLHAWAQDVRKAVGPQIGDVYTVDSESLNPLAGTLTLAENHLLPRPKRLGNPKPRRPLLGRPRVR